MILVARAGFPKRISIRRAARHGIRPSGNFHSGWGGQSGAGINGHSNEHGSSWMTMDLCGLRGMRMVNRTTPPIFPNDNQISEFTNDGKFVMALARVAKRQQQHPYPQGCNRYFVNTKI